MEELGINFALLAPLLLIQLLLAIIGLVAWFKTEETNGPRMLWLVIILLVSYIGPILFFIFGRRQ
ncbi:PLDc N-terminal domain-containing protein [Saliterribacillus persicus]|uniref:Phospholipase D-like protein n=1 Tax=Saliterribacillus persicus TaxID=930114 RepID=A0A368X960_9BACI|nr:PLDc N-terminal domain-containing protein [Saliterribacillus persicus]RCW62977.1 phospholipase D-like protein [Saliterribacillus persicus]